MKTTKERLAEFGAKKEAHILEVVNSIRKGAKFNGKFYTSNGKITIYVDGELKLIGEIKFHGEELKEIFQLLLKESGHEEIPSGKLSYGEAWRLFGLDYAEEGNKTGL